MTPERKIEVKRRLINLQKKVEARMVDFDNIELPEKRTAVNTFATIRTELEDELKLFTSGYRMTVDSDQQNIKLIDGLAEKIEHMCIYIGCPSSVEPMLKSICSGKVKRWGKPNWEYYSETNGYSDKPIEKLRGRIHIAERDRKYERIVKGHFRWDFTAYTANYQTRDYIKQFFKL